MSEAGEQSISPYDRLVWPPGVVESLLASGERRRELAAYFGEAEYLALQPLARAAARARQDPDRCVVLVPGIMGTQLGRARAAPLPADLLWLDPLDLRQGRLAELALPTRRPLQPLGPVLYSYLPLKLALQAAGWSVRYFDYDWRLDLNDTAAVLAAQLGAERAASLHVIAHSMGGLAARVALSRPQAGRVRSLITLGTPFRGAYAAVQALRGVYPLVRRVAQLDLHHDAAGLATSVFSTFPSLYQMLPRDAVPDLHASHGWPATGPQPQQALLGLALAAEDTTDPRIQCIAGWGTDTVVRSTLEEDGFRYHLDRRGDGTVAVASAVLPGAPSACVHAAHSELPRRRDVHAALLNLLEGLPAGLASAPPALPQAQRHHTDDDLGQLFTGKLDWLAMSPAQRRHFLDSLNETILP